MRSALGPSCGLSAGWLRPFTPDGYEGMVYKLMNTDI